MSLAMPRGWLGCGATSLGQRQEAGMADSRWSRIDELFHRAAELTSKERLAFLEHACNGDEELRREVESLLDADSRGQTRIAHTAVDRVVDELKSEPCGNRVGRYTITGLIGKGGMGAVYRAVREDDFRMEVAIKLLKRGTGTDAALSRFRNERQILAGLQHPNIAHLLDGGATEEGLPYFVMEYVDGTPLLEHAAPLSIRERLELFRSVCSAIQYAHERLIVHRDIKPANILVTADGVPKLLDFGIAKLLDPAGGGWKTLTGVRLMTPGYASPEQVRGEPVTTASDIYSLGAVLHELLTGQRANCVETYSSGDTEPEIRIREPKKPSAVAKDLDSDLDNIILMALRSDPQQRYGTAEQFSEDIRRYLAGEPVTARKPTRLYRFTKLVKRNRTATIAAVASAALVMALTAGLSRFRIPDTATVGANSIPGRAAAGESLGGSGARVFRRRDHRGADQ